MAGIIIELTVDDKGTVKVKQFTDEAKKAFDQMKKGPEDAKGPLASLQEGWVALTAKIAVASAAIYTVVRTISSLVAEAAEFEASETRLGFAVDRAGYSWNTWKSYVDAWNESIVKTTLFTDTQANQALARMLMYTTNLTEAQKGARLAMDLSTRSGEPLEETLRMIGMAMTGNVEILGRYFPQFRNLNTILGENASLDTKAAYAMKVLTDQFGGMGKQLPIFKDEVTEFNKSWGDTKKLFGEDLLPPITAVLNIFKGALEEIRAFKQELKEGYGLLEEKPTPQKGPMAIFTVDEGLPEKIKTTVLDPYAKYKKIVEEVTAALESTIQIEDERGQVAMGRQELIEMGWVKEKNLVEQVKEELTRLDSEMNEWGEVSVARQELVESGWNRVKDAQSETRRILTEYAKTFGDTALEQKIRLEELAVETEKLQRLGVPQEAIQKYTQAVKSNMSEMTSTWQELGNNINSVWSENVTGILKGTTTIKDAFKNMATGMADAFISAVTKMIANWILFQNVQGTYKVGQGLIGLIGGIFAQEGGIFNQPTPAIIGEAGPEAVIPLKGGKIPIEGSQGQTIINHNYFGVTDAEGYRRMALQNKDLHQGMALAAFSEGKRRNLKEFRNR